MGASAVDASTTVWVIHELVHVRARRVDRADAIEQARQTHMLLRPLLQSTEDDLQHGLEMFGKYRLGAFDAVLAATAMRERATLVSADTAFADVDGLRHLDPGSPTFVADLGIG